MEDIFNIQRTRAEALSFAHSPKQYRKGVRTLYGEKRLQALRRLLTKKGRPQDTQLSVHLHQKKHGWIDMIVKTESVGTLIWLSNVFDPFLDFVWWMEGAWHDSLLICWEVEEEGKYTICSLFAVDDTQVRLSLLRNANYDEARHRLWDVSHIQIDTIIPKGLFIKSFWEEFRRFSKEYDQKDWGDNIPTCLARLEELFQYGYEDAKNHPYN